MCAMKRLRDGIGRVTAGAAARGEALVAVAVCVSLAMGAVALARDWPVPGKTPADLPPADTGACFYVQSGGPVRSLSTSAGLTACDLAQSDPVSAAGLGPPVGPRLVRGAASPDVPQSASAHPSTESAALSACVMSDRPSAGRSQALPERARQEREAREVTCLALSYQRSLAGEAPTYAEQMRQVRRLARAHSAVPDPSVEADVP
jgi:hypothetical protein